MKVDRLCMYLVTALAVGCVSAAPFSTSFSSPKDRQELFQCATTQVNQLGFTVLDANKEAGFMRAERNVSEARNVMVGLRYFEVLSISVYDDTDNGHSAMRVTAESQQQRGAGSREGIGTPSRLRDMAEHLAMSCASR
jgi:hypothetical protein